MCKFESSQKDESAKPNRLINRKSTEYLEHLFVQLRCFICFCRVKHSYGDVTESSIHLVRYKYYYNHLSLYISSLFCSTTSLH